MLTREGIVRVLADAGVEVVGSASDVDGLMYAIVAERPDCAIVDIRMPPTKTDEGLRAAREIRDRHPMTGVLVLSQYVEVENAVELFADRPAGMGRAWADDLTWHRIRF